jgi:hypothetical protein
MAGAPVRLLGTTTQGGDLQCPRKRFRRLDATCRDQQQDHQEQEAETSATVVAGTIEGPAAAPVSKTTKKCDDEDDQEDGAKRHAVSFRRNTLKQRSRLSIVPHPTAPNGSAPSGTRKSPWISEVEIAMNGTRSSAAGHDQLARTKARCALGSPAN